MTIETAPGHGLKGDNEQVYFPRDAYKRLARLVARWAELTDDAQESVVTHVEEIAETAQHGMAPPEVRLRSKRKPRTARRGSK
jgi:hypothetical protein